VRRDRDRAATNLDRQIEDSNPSHRGKACRGSVFRVSNPHCVATRAVCRIQPAPPRTPDGNNHSYGFAQKATWTQSVPSAVADGLTIRSKKALAITRLYNVPIRYRGRY